MLGPGWKLIGIPSFLCLHWFTSFFDQTFRYVYFNLLVKYLLCTTDLCLSKHHIASALRARSSIYMTDLVLCYRTPFLSCSFLSTRLQPALVSQSAWGHLWKCSACETECETRALRSQKGLKDDLVWPASQDISAEFSLTGYGDTGFYEHLAFSQSCWYF